jgi:transposase
VKTVSLDVHAEASQVVVVDESGEVQFEMKVPTQPEALRAVVAGVAGPKRVVFEEGPLSAMVQDALKDVCEKIISCDPAHNALIARAEDASDERDARRLAKLAQLDAVRPVYVPAEPYRTLRSVLAHDHQLERSATEVQNRIKALGRRQGIRTRGKGIYWHARRPTVLTKMPNPALRWEMESLYRQLDLLRRERVGARRLLGHWTRPLPVIARLQGIPGVGPITARTLVGWIADPCRFKSRNALSSYAGLGLGQGRTNWKPVGRARASKRGNRLVKRVLFLAAKAAAKTDTRLARRYAARLEAGWKPDKAIRDLARTILETACCLWRKGLDYDDRRVSVPATPKR